MTYATNINIVRSTHQKNFSVINNFGIDDDRLDPTALAILVKRLRKPDSWVMIPKAIAREMGKNIDTIRKYLRQLEEYGYLVRRVLKDAHGRYAGYHYVLIEEGTGEGVSNETAQTIACNPVIAKKTENSVPGSFSPESLGHIVNIEDNKYISKQILDLSPTPQKFQYQEEEIDFWLDSPSDEIQTEAAQTETLEFEASNIDLPEPEVTINLGTAMISGEERSSAADYNQTTISNIKPTRQERRSDQREATWVEFGKQNGLWQSLEELQGFMTALYRHAVNNPRLHTPSKWVESEVQKTCDRGTGTHWMEYCAGLVVGTVDHKPWADVYGNVDLSFRSYIEQSKFGESGNSTSRAVELAAQVLADPFKAGLLWNEYQRRLERELEEKAKCELLGVTYTAPSVLKPKSQVSTAATAQTQQILGIDAASQVYQPGIAQSVSVPALEAADEVEPILNLSEAPWDLIAEKMSELGEQMGFSKSNSKPLAIPLSEVYAEPKPVNQAEAKEFTVWYDLAKAKGLVDYSYGDSKHHAIVVLADGVTALPWREAKGVLARI